MPRDLFNENLRSLCKTDKALAERIEKSLSISQEIEVFVSRNGMPTAKVKGVLLHSLYDPKASARRMLDRYDLKDKELVIILGFGLGYHIIEAAKRTGQDTKLLIIEPQLNLFRLAMKKMDLSVLLSNGQIRLSIGDDIPDIAKLFNDEKILGANLLLIEHSPSAKLSPDHFRYVRILLSGNQTHLKRRSSIRLKEDDFLQLLIEGMLFKNWPNYKIKVRNILTSPGCEYNRILIIQLASIGDVVYTTPVFSGLKEKFKEATLFFLTERLTSPLVRFDPHIDEVITFDKTEFLQGLFGSEGIEGTKTQLKEFIEETRGKDFDLVINLHTSPRGAVLAKMIGEREVWGLTLDEHGTPCVVGPPWMHYKYWTMKKNDTGGLGIVELHLLMANVDPIKRETAIYVDETSNKKANGLLDSHGLSEKEELIGLFPGSNYPSRRWPRENFATLGDLIQILFRARVIIFGGPDEREVADWIARSMQIPPINLAGKTTLLELAALLERCSMLITNDTGPLHIACAMKTPTITLAGPAWIGPYGPGHLLLAARLPCIGCPKFVCRDHTCMELVTPEAVVTTIGILRELHKEIRDESTLERLLSSPDLKEVEVFYSGNKPPGKLFALAPLVKIRTDPMAIKEAVMRFTALNVWGIEDNGKPHFSPDEIAKRLWQNFLIEDSKGIKEELNKVRNHLKEIRELCLGSLTLSERVYKDEETRGKIVNRLNQIRHKMSSLPLFEAIEYLSPAPEPGFGERDLGWIEGFHGMREEALTMTIKTIDGVIELISNEQLIEH